MCYSDDMSSKIMSTNEFAAKYGFAQETVQRWCRTKRIPSLNFAGEYRIDEDEALEVIRNGHA